jgi:cytoskeletal protein CcmA (bactofilin family)
MTSVWQSVHWVVRPLALAALLVVLAAQPAAARQPRPGEVTEVFDEQTRVVLTGGAVIPPGDTVEGVAVFDGPAVVQGTVDGSVFAMNGPVRVSGRVNGNVVAPNGRVTVTDGGFVDGDVSAEQVAAAPGTVSGSVRRGNVNATLSFAPSLAVWLAISVSVLVLGAILVMLAPRAAEAVAAAGRRRPGAAALAGILVFLGLIVLIILSLLSIVGIPLGFILLGGLLLIYAVGYVAAMLVLGRLVMRSASPLVAFLVGFAILRVVALIPWIGGVITFLAAVFGLGALLVSTRRAQREHAPREPAAATA